VSARSKTLVPPPNELVPVLLVSFSADDQATLCQIFAHPNWQLHGRASCKQALEFLSRYRVPIVVCDRDQLDGNWRDLVDGAQELEFPSNLIVCSSLPDEYLWAEVLNLGGWDVLVKPFESHEVLRVAYTAWQSWKRRSGETIRRAKSKSATVSAEQPPERFLAATPRHADLPD
jgi:DNA-binding NtrC family response regulator